LAKAKTHPKGRHKGLVGEVWMKLANCLTLQSIALNSFSLIFLTQLLKLFRAKNLCFPKSKEILVIAGGEEFRRVLPTFLQRQVFQLLEDGRHVGFVMTTFCVELHLHIDHKNVEKVPDSLSTYLTLVFSLQKVPPSTHNVKFVSDSQLFVII